MKRYKFTMPTPAKARNWGIKFEGLAINTQYWLLGVVTGVSACGTDKCCNLYLSGKQSFDIETNSTEVLNIITKRLEGVGFTRELA